VASSTPPEATLAPSDQPAAQTNGSPKKGPSYRFRYPVHEGTLSVSVFERTLERDGREQLLFSVTVQRSYYSEKEKGWLWTSYLRDMDVPVALVGLTEAYRYICTRKMPDEDIPF